MSLPLSQGSRMLSTKGSACLMLAALGNGTASAVANLTGSEVLG